MRLESYPKNMHADSVCDALGMKPRKRYDRLRQIVALCTAHRTFEAQRLLQEAREAIEDDYDRALLNAPWPTRVAAQ
jgi:hypothetical protein